MFFGLVGRELQSGPSVDDDPLGAYTWESVELFGDAIRSAGTCGPAVEVPPDADEQTRLIGYLGRHP